MNALIKTLSFINKKSKLMNRYEEKKEKYFTALRKYNNPKDGEDREELLYKAEDIGEEFFDAATELLVFNDSSPYGPCNKIKEEAEYMLPNYNL